MTEQMDLTLSDSDALQSLLQMSLFIGIALLVSALIFNRVQSLSPYYAYIVLHLSFLSLGPSHTAVFLEVAPFSEKRRLGRKVSR